MINVIYNYYSNGLLTPFEIKLFIRNKRFRDYVISLCPKEKQRDYKDDFKNFKRQEPYNRSARIFQPIERKIDLMLSSEVLKYMTCQEENVLNLPKLFDEGYYIFVNAKEGILGSEHVRYIATYISTLVRHAVVFRGTGYKKDVFLFYDEFQKFCSSQVTGDFAEIRKYGLHPCVSHQHHSQLYSLKERNHVLNSLLNNFDEKLCGRLSNPEDARNMRDAMEAADAEKKYKLFPKDITELEDYHFYYDSIEKDKPLDPVMVRIYPQLFKEAKEEIIKNPDTKKDIQKMSDDYQEFEKTIDLKKIVKENPFLNNFGKTRDEIKEDILIRKKKFNLITYERLADIKAKEKKEKMIKDIKEREKDLLVKNKTDIPLTEENFLIKEEGFKKFSDDSLIMLLYKCKFLKYRQVLDFYENKIKIKTLYNKISKLKKKNFLETIKLHFGENSVKDLENKNKFSKNTIIFLAPDSLHNVLSLLNIENKKEMQKIKDKINSNYEKLINMNKKNYYGSIHHTFISNEILLQIIKVDNESINFKLVNWEVEPRPKYAGFDGEGVVRRIKPDLIIEFAIYSKVVGSWTNFHFIIENDLGTKMGTSFKNKIKRYKQFFESGAYMRYFPKHVKPGVLFIVKGIDETRSYYIIDVIKEVLEEDLDLYDFYVTNCNYFKANIFKIWLKAGYENKKDGRLKFSNITKCKRAIYHSKKSDEYWEDIEFVDM